MRQGQDLGVEIFLALHGHREVKRTSYHVCLPVEEKTLTERTMVQQSLYVFEALHGTEKTIVASIFIDGDLLAGHDCLIAEPIVKSMIGKDVIISIYVETAMPVDNL